MLSIRAVTAGAVFLVMAVSGAEAQTATDTAPGKPIPLLQILAKPEKTKAKVHSVRKLSRRAAKIHVAARARLAHHRIRLATAAPPMAAAPVLNDAAPSAELAAAAAPPPAPQPVASSSAQLPDQLVFDGRPVRVASTNDVNVIDRAADAQPAQTPAVAAAPAAPAPATTTAAAAPAPPAQAAMTQVADAAPAPQTVAVARASQDASAVGSATWIAQVLAALGGAVAAGAAAWFLIGSAPRRTYG